MEGLTPHRWADGIGPVGFFNRALTAEDHRALAAALDDADPPGFDPAAAEAMNAAAPRFTKSAVAASLVRNPAFEVGTKGWRTHPLFVRDTELPDFDFPTWRVRHRPYDYETDGC